MKALALSLISLLSIAQAGATSLAPFFHVAELDGFKFDAQSPLSTMTVKQGQVLVNLSRQYNIEVTVNPTSVCPEGTMCIQMMPAPITFTAAIRTVDIGACNETIYTAMSDLRPADGIRTEITVVDNSTNTCMYYVAIPGTEVQIKILGSRPAFEYTHEMTGGNLSER